MTKKSFYGLLFCGILGGCAFIESAMPTYEIAKAESESVYSLSGAKTDTEIHEALHKEHPKATCEEIEDLMFGNWREEAPDYDVYLIGDSIKVLDSDTGKLVFSEHYESGSEFTKAILKDNE